MLRPTKHTDPRLSVLHGAALMLHDLQKKRIVSYDDCVSKLRKSLGADFEPDFVAYVGFLYLLGRVSYSEKTDSFVYAEETLP